MHTISGAKSFLQSSHDAYGHHRSDGIEKFIMQVSYVIYISIVINVFHIIKKYNLLKKGISSICTTKSFLVREKKFEKDMETKTSVTGQHLFHLY